MIVTLVFTSDTAVSDNDTDDSANNSNSSDNKIRLDN